MVGAVITGALAERMVRKGALVLVKKLLGFQRLTEQATTDGILIKVVGMVEMGFRLVLQELACIMAAGVVVREATSELMLAVRVDKAEVALLL
tara:strand:- start:237 stop:515 length:279 start_codon:yes stop_codon:yes gene_type:complete